MIQKRTKAVRYMFGIPFFLTYAYKEEWPETFVSGHFQAYYDKCGNYFRSYLFPAKSRRIMKKFLFKGLLALNKRLLPKYSGRDPATLNKWQLAILGFRYWVLKNAL